jgi:cytochrome c biogenesis protein
MKSLLKSFSSVKLAIILLIIITSASIIGTFIPQGRSLAEYTQRYGQLATLFTRLQLINLYHSWWFIGLLFLFSLNIIICTLTRLFPKLRKTFRPKLEFEPKTINTLKIREKFNKNWNLAKTMEELRKEFSSRHYRFKEGESDNKIFMVARKKVLGWFGSDVVHLGLLIILAGGIISGLGGFRTNLTFSEGQVLSVPRANFSLRLDKFETEYYPNGSVKDWKSTMTVMEDEKSLFSKIIEVNHPLSYKGFVFYQSSYGWNWENPSLEILVRKRNDPSFLSKLELRVGQRVNIEGENIQFSFLHFIPDFVINEKNEIASRSNEPNNPAAFIEGWQQEEKIFSGWIFAQFPDFARIHSEKETDLIFELKNFKSSHFSVIQAAKDPGVNAIWVGCGFLMLGLALAFYWPTREIRVILEESQGKTEISAGGIASKNREAFQSEFEKMMTSLRRSK